MDLKQFIDNFAEQLDATAEELGLTLETRFRDLDDWTSLVALLVMSMIDEEYDVTLSAEEMVAASTIGDLYTCVSNKL